MPRAHKTDRGPKAIVSAPPFTIATMYDLLCGRGRCIQRRVNHENRIAIDDPAIAHLMHVVNFIQWKVRAIPHEENVSEAIYLRAWSPWVVSGIRPMLQRFPGGMSIEPAGFGRGSIALGEPADEHTAALAARAHAFDLIRGTSLFSGKGSISGNILTIIAMTSGSLARGAIISGTGIFTGTQIIQQLSGTAGGVGTYEVSVGEQTVASTTVSDPYHIWLATEARVPLLTRSIRAWTDYAPDLPIIFRSELRPDPGHLAAFRFIQMTAPTITGEGPSFYAVQTELSRGRWRNRKRQNAVQLP
jgi:hypothetical protein